jgi:hypothetical protein
LVRLKVDVILAASANAAQAVKNATRTIPIVFVSTQFDRCQMAGDMELKTLVNVSPVIELTTRRSLVTQNSREFHVFPSGLFVA